MKILLIEPFFTGSHRRWATELQKFSAHEVTLLTLPGRHWKWRMYGGAVSLAAEFEKLQHTPELILATDMLDLATFLALTRRKTAGIPTAIYFHENQITYPWSPTDADVEKNRNNQYGFVNYTSALAADAVLFNSQYHRDSLLGALPDFLRQFPDRRNMNTVKLMEEKTTVLPLGLDLKRYEEVGNVPGFIQKVTLNHPVSEHESARLRKNKYPVLLWNHRWEYDKNPEDFFTALLRLEAEGINFQLIVTGENYKSAPPIFAAAKEKLKDKILHFGYVRSFADYARLLHTADILPVTSRQDFFGGSVVEAMYCNCFPLLPDRLAYPEHLPPALHSKHLYKGREDFYAKLKGVITDFAKGERESDFRRFVAHYDWSVCAEKYDEILQRIATEHQSKTAT